jgi:GTP-binding protein HflX
MEAFPNSVAISAKDGIGIDALLEIIETVVTRSEQSTTYVLPYQEGRLISQFHEIGRVDSINHNESSVSICGWLPEYIQKEYEQYINENPNSPD